MNKPLVSVIINCYNGETYLNEAISSAINQSYKNIEIIFWDNQSTDSSKAIVNSFDDGRIRYFYAINEITNPFTQFKLMKTDVNVEPTGGFSTGTVSVQSVWTSDPTISPQWFSNQPNIEAANYKSFFTKKELSVQNKNPTLPHLKYFKLIRNETTFGGYPKLITLLIWN